MTDPAESMLRVNVTHGWVLVTSKKCAGMKFSHFFWIFDWISPLPTFCLEILSQDEVHDLKGNVYELVRYSISILTCLPPGPFSSPGEIGEGRVGQLKILPWSNKPEIGMTARLLIKSTSTERIESPLPEIIALQAVRITLSETEQYPCLSFVNGFAKLCVSCIGG